MKIIPCEQGSVDWALARSGIPTASEFKHLITPKFQLRTGQMVDTYVAKKVAEAWQGGPLAEFNTFDMEQGRILEEEALPWFSLETGLDIQRVGFITNDAGTYGCSPDGLIGETGGIEVKCPSVPVHVGYLLEGQLPDEYAPQVYGCMLVTGRREWTFISYCRRFPKLVVKVESDDARLAVLREAIGRFGEMFAAAMKRMEELNGGPPKRPGPLHPPTP